MNNKGQQLTVQKQFQQLTKAYRNIANGHNSLGTPSDSQQFRQKLQKDVKEAFILCKQMRQSLEELESNGVPINQVNKFKEQFSKEVDKLQDITEQITIKEKQYKVQNVSGSMSQREVSESPLLIQNQSYNQQPFQQQQQESQFIVHMENGELERREEQAYGMLEDLQQLNEMFKDLHELVHEQDEPIQALTNNVQQVHDEVAAGTQQLEKAQEYQKGYRKKMCYVLIVVLIIACIAAIVIYTQTKK